MSRERGGGYWWRLGPVTRAEDDKAFSYFRKANKPFDRKSAAYRNYISKLRKRKELNRFLRGKAPSSAEPSAPWQVIYGEVETGGTITFAHTSGPDANDPHRFLHLIITVACHEIHSIATVYFDGYPLTWGTDLSTRPTGQVNATGIFDGKVIMQINYGTDSQSALSVPVGLTTGYKPVGSKWTSDHRQRGHAHVYLRLEHNENVFKKGTPDISFRIRGRYITDPRNASSNGGAANAAMVLYDYMTNTKFGMGISTSAFNTTRLNQAVNDCEDNISLVGGGVENRYLINTSFTVDEAPGSVIDEMLASMSGRLVYSEGKWSVFAGKARSPVVTLSESDILSGIQVVTKTPTVDNFNSVRGTFISTANNYEEADFPPVENTAYITEDNGEKVYEDLTFGMVTSGTMAQRLAKIELESARQGIFVEFIATLKAYQAEVGEWISLTFAEFGWSSKTFEVVGSALLIQEDDNGVPAFVVRLTLKEQESQVYDWTLSDEQSHDIYPNTDLPNPFTVQPPSGITLASGTEHLYIRKDGTVFSRLYVIWTAAPDTFVQSGGYYEVQYHTETLGWVDYSDVPGSSTSCYILDVQDGIDYLVRVRSVNALGARSEWVTSTPLHTVIGKTAPPSNVSSVSARVTRDGVTLEWSPVLDLDVKEYEIRFAAVGQTWEQAVNNNPQRAQATSFKYSTFAAGTWQFFVKAIDTSGNYSQSAASTTLTVAAPSVVNNLSIKTIDNTILIDWEEPQLTVFPVSHYQVFKQVSGTLTSLGKVTGTFFSQVELLAGSYTYIVIPVDSAGNQGPSTTIQRTVYEPSDFVLRDESPVDLSTATLANSVYIPSTFTVQAAANLSETWEQHFINNNAESIQDLIDGGYDFWLEPSGSATGTVPISTTGPSVWMPYTSTNSWEDHFLQNNFDSIQDFIDAGFTYWLQPSTGAAETWLDIFSAFGATTLQELYDAGVTSFGQDFDISAPAASVTIDYDMGEVLPQTIVVFDYQLISNGFVPVPQVFWRQTTTEPWFSGRLGDIQVTPAGFRYLRLVITGQPQSVQDWAVISAPTVRVTVKEIADGGIVNVFAADVSGTTIPFTKAFLDVSSLVVSAAGSTDLKAVRTFPGGVNPTSFQAYLFNAAGTRVDGTISWHARGVQAVI